MSYKNTFSVEGTQGFSIFIHSDHKQMSLEPLLIAEGSPKSDQT